MAVNQPARPVIGQPNGTGGIVNEWDLKYYDDIWGAPGTQDTSGKTTGITVYGTPTERGGENAARSNASIYYGSSQQLGEDAQDYRNRIKGKLDEKSGAANRMTQVANQDISRANAKAGLNGVDTTAASIRERRNAISKSNEVEQAQNAINLSNYGKSIGAGISGTEALAAAGAGRALAATPGQTPSYSGGLSIICTELFFQKKLSLREIAGCNEFGRSVDDNTYSGYIVIATPIVFLMKKSDKISNLFVGWAKSISKNNPNRFTRIMMPICFVIGSFVGVKNARRA